jgi:hypothetical protein
MNGGRLCVILSISTSNSKGKRRVKRTKPDGARAGMSELVAGPRGDKRTTGGQDEGEKV